MTPVWYLQLATMLEPAAPAATCSLEGYSTSYRQGCLQYIVYSTSYCKLPAYSSSPALPVHGNLQAEVSAIRFKALPGTGMTPVWYLRLATMLEPAAPAATCSLEGYSTSYRQGCLQYIVL